MFSEYEKINNEKEEMGRELEELRRKNDEIENHLNQLKSSLISRLGDEFRTGEFDNPASSNTSFQDEPDQNRY